MTEKEEKAIEYVKEFIEELQCDINMFGFEDDCEEVQNLLIEQRDNFSTILKALEQKDEEIQKLKEKWNKDTHTLQNQLDIANADRVEKDKMIDLFKRRIDLFKRRIVITENEHKEILKIQEKFLEKDFQDCLIIYFQKKAREENENV